MAIDGGVTARAAIQDVVAGATFQAVGAGVAGDPIVQGIAAAIEIGHTGQQQVLHIVCQRVAGRGLHGVDAGVGPFMDGHQGIGNDIAIIAGAAGQADQAAAVKRVAVGAALYFQLHGIALGIVALAVDVVMVGA
ncbi:hypothetical protein D9M68_526840 [compost metagenome]